MAESLEAYINKNTYTSVAILVDENTQKHCLPLINEVATKHPTISIKSGEDNKVLSTCSYIWEQMTELKLDRNSLLINLGGGVIGDMGGFCAATYKRGIDFINVPTTVLAQVDASVGGKLGIDFNGFKNHIGLFISPKAIFLNHQFLTTLPKRELRSGFAEIIKHALIANTGQWNDIKLKSLDEISFEELILKSVDIKYKIVTQDPLEKGERKVLNFGHSIGHALESHFLQTNSRLLHGEAIAIGMICESQIAFKKALITELELNEISQYIVNIYGKIDLPTSSFGEVEKLLIQDKKNKGNKILMALPNGIGKAIWDVEVDSNQILNSLKYYTNL